MGFLYCQYPSGYSLVDKLDNFFSKKALTVVYSINRILILPLGSLIACSSANLLGNIINTLAELLSRTLLTSQHLVFWYKET